ncbi:hypothetical protein C8D87_10642 [Lentzea atacamensis]|uniref:Histone H2A n=1 Tax=Lentzea atacamensis TaxID=531938 RepID=A0ABX9E5C8_9PSEU|nr:hypothetical protein [Lentzea atacamensis]RAS63641.1 hypothetical protein C8D87_10642 [Lentzea atacamensis]
MSVLSYVDNLVDIAGGGRKKKRTSGKGKSSKQEALQGAGCRGRPRTA